MIDLKKIFIVLLCIVILTGCNNNEDNMNNNDNNNKTTYKEITQEVAYQMMDDSVVIIDVREKDEYSSGHIKNSINISVNHIRNKINDYVTDKSKVILLYCRSGARAKEAAQYLINMGYSNVYTFGGIQTWPYEIVY